MDLLDLPVEAVQFKSGIDEMTPFVLDDFHIDNHFIALSDINNDGFNDIVFEGLVGEMARSALIRKVKLT